MLMLINVVNRTDDGFCIFLTLGRPRLIDGSWDREEGYAPAITSRAGALAIRNVAGKAAAPAARRGNSRRAIFIAPSPTPSYIKFTIV